MQSKQQIYNLDYKPNLTTLAAKRAISLFEAIPENRSCTQAYIGPHWCACLKWQPISITYDANNSLSLILANSIVNSINMATYAYRDYCAILKLYKINWIMHLIPKKNWFQYSQTHDMDSFMAKMNNISLIMEEIYQLQIVLLPGESLFEATVNFDKRTGQATTKLADISRINKYGRQANCMYKRNPELRKYCYCNEW